MSLIYHNQRDLVFTEYKDYLMTSVVSDYGIYEKKYKVKDHIVIEDMIKIEGFYWELKLILMSRDKALELLEVLNQDTIQHKKLNHSDSVRDEDRRYKVEVFGTTFDSLLTKSEAETLIQKLRERNPDFNDFGCINGTERYIIEMPL